MLDILCPQKEANDEGGMRCLRTDEACRWTYDEVATVLKTDVHSGLAWQEANRRLSLHGYNEFEVTPEEPLWKKYIEQVSFWCSYKLHARLEF